MTHIQTRILRTLKAASPLACSGLLLQKIADATADDIEALVATGAIVAASGAYRLR